jgi:glycosyltransferase involved in cell wall biosynthesis
MKVLFLATRDWRNPGAAGGDIQMWEYARYLAARAHTVTFLASSFVGAPREELVDSVHVVRLGGVLSLWLRTFLHYMLHCRGKYDIIVAEGFGGARIPRLVPLYAKEPVVTEWHQIHRDLFASQYPRLFVPVLCLFERSVAFIHRNTRVRAGTKEWQEAFSTIGFRRENVFLVPVSIREQWLAGSVERVSAPTIVWLGKFRRYKCPDHAIAAMKEVVAQVPAARLILAGRHDDRKYEQRLQRLCNELGIGGNVEFRFNLTEDEKLSLLRSCRVMVLPSSVEGFGIVVLEANACGVPVIASSGVPEGAVQHEYNGLRYPFGDIAALARSIIRLLRHDELHARLSTNSVAFARQFSWQQVGAQFEEALGLALHAEESTTV